MIAITIPATTNTMITTWVQNQWRGIDSNASDPVRMAGEMPQVASARGKRTATPRGTISTG